MNLDREERARRLGVADDMLRQLEAPPGGGLSRRSSDILSPEDKAALFIMNIAKRTGCDNAARQRIGDKALEALAVADGERHAHLVVDHSKAPPVIDFMVFAEEERPAEFTNETHWVVDLSNLAESFRKE